LHWILFPGPALDKSEHHNKRHADDQGLVFVVQRLILPDILPNAVMLRNDPLSFIMRGHILFLPFVKSWTLLPEHLPYSFYTHEVFSLFFFFFFVFFFFFFFFLPKPYAHCRRADFSLFFLLPYLGCRSITEVECQCVITASRQNPFPEAPFSF